MTFGLLPVKPGFHSHSHPCESVVASGWTCDQDFSQLLCYMSVILALDGECTALKGIRLTVFSLLGELVIDQPL